MQPFATQSGMCGLKKGLQTPYPLYALPPLFPIPQLLFLRSRVDLLMPGSNQPQQSLRKTAMIRSVNETLRKYTVCLVRRYNPKGRDDEIIAMGIRHKWQVNEVWSYHWKVILSCYSHDHVSKYPSLASSNPYVILISVCHLT
jgi:hypothetical protein